jgi:hypothetical protein
MRGAMRGALIIAAVFAIGHWFIMDAIERLNVRVDDVG